MINAKPILTIDKLMGTNPRVANCDAGCRYLYWEIDRLALQENAICEICGETVDCGWELMDGGGIYCDNCVIYIQDAGGYMVYFSKLISFIFPKDIGKAHPRDLESSIVYQRGLTNALCAQARKNAIIRKW